MTGRTDWLPRRIRWRELCFTYRELCSAIVPHMGLSHVLTHWPEIGCGLAKSRCKRGWHEVAVTSS